MCWLWRQAFLSPARPCSEHAELDATLADLQLQSTSETRDSGLTPADRYYRQVTRAEQVILPLTRRLDSPDSDSRTAEAINNILLVRQSRRRLAVLSYPSPLRTALN